MWDHMEQQIDYRSTRIGETSLPIAELRLADNCDRPPFHSSCYIPLLRTSSKHLGQRRSTTTSTLGQSNNVRVYKGSSTVKGRKATMTTHRHGGLYRSSVATHRLELHDHEFISRVIIGLDRQRGESELLPSSRSPRCVLSESTPSYHSSLPFKPLRVP